MFRTHLEEESVSAPLWRAFSSEEMDIYTVKVHLLLWDDNSDIPFPVSATYICSLIYSLWTWKMWNKQWRLLDRCQKWINLLSLLSSVMPSWRLQFYLFCHAILFVFGSILTFISYRAGVPVNRMPVSKRLPWQRSYMWRCNTLPTHITFLSLKSYIWYCSVMFFLFCIRYKWMQGTFCLSMQWLLLYEHLGRIRVQV